MARVCEVCGKGYKKGNSVTKGIGQRVSRRTIRKQQPNLRNKKIEINGKTVKLRLCAACLKKIKFEKRASAENSETPVKTETTKA